MLPYPNQQDQSSTQTSVVVKPLGSFNKLKNLEFLFTWFVWKKKNSEL